MVRDARGLPCTRASSVLDEHFAVRWAALGPEWQHRRAGPPAMRTSRYADDFVDLIAGTCDDAEVLWDEVGAVLTSIMDNKVRSLTRRDKHRTLTCRLAAPGYENPDRWSSSKVTPSSSSSVAAYRRAASRIRLSPCACSGRRPVFGATRRFMIDLARTSAFIIPRQSPSPEQPGTLTPAGPGRCSRAQRSTSAVNALAAAARAFKLVLIRPKACSCQRPGGRYRDRYRLPRDPGRASPPPAAARHAAGRPHRGRDRPDALAGDQRADRRGAS